MSEFGKATIESLSEFMTSQLPKRSAPRRDARVIRRKRVNALGRIRYVNLTNKNNHRQAIFGGPDNRGSHRYRMALKNYHASCLP